MTKEEAIIVLESFINVFNLYKAHDNAFVDMAIGGKAIQAFTMSIEALEQNVKLKEAIEKMDKWVHSGNRGNCDYFIVDQVEEIINGLKKDGMVSE